MSASSSVTVHGPPVSGAGGLGVGVGGGVRTGEGWAGGLSGPTQRIASATTTPVALSESITPWLAPGWNSYWPSDCQVPPPTCWFTATLARPAVDITWYSTISARFGPLD